MSFLLLGTIPQKDQKTFSYKEEEWTVLTTGPQTVLASLCLVIINLVMKSRAVVATITLMWNSGCVCTEASYPH